MYNIIMEIIIIAVAIGIICIFSLVMFIGYTIIDMIEEQEYA